MVPNATDAQKMPEQDKAPAYLVYEFERRAYPLTGETFSIGRDAGSRIVIRQKVSQRDLASMAGIARENVSRIVNEWMRANIITRQSGYYCLENPAKLEREIEI